MFGWLSVADMRANTEYSGYSAASPVIQWFWEVVQGFSKEDKARLLQFVTGTSKVRVFGNLLEPFLILLCVSVRKFARAFLDSFLSLFGS